MRLIAVVAATAMLAVAGPAVACAFDGMPGYSHYAPDGTDPYAGAYAEAAARIADRMASGRYGGGQGQAPRVVRTASGSDVARVPGRPGRSIVTGRPETMGPDVRDALDRARPGQRVIITATMADGSTHTLGGGRDGWTVA